MDTLLRKFNLNVDTRERDIERAARFEDFGLKRGRVGPTTEAAGGGGGGGSGGGVG